MVRLPWFTMVSQFGRIAIVRGFCVTSGVVGRSSFVQKLWAVWMVLVRRSVVGVDDGEILRWSRLEVVDFRLSEKTSRHLVSPRRFRVIRSYHSWDIVRCNNDESWSCDYESSRDGYSLRFGFCYVYEKISLPQLLFAINPHGGNESHSDIVCFIVRGYLKKS